MTIRTDCNPHHYFLGEFCLSLKPYFWWSVFLCSSIISIIARHFRGKYDSSSIITTLSEDGGQIFRFISCSSDQSGHFSLLWNFIFFSSNTFPTCPAYIKLLCQFFLCNSFLVNSSLILALSVSFLDGLPEPFFYQWYLSSQTF